MKFCPLNLDYIAYCAIAAVACLSWLPADYLVGWQQALAAAALLILLGAGAAYIKWEKLAKVLNYLAIFVIFCAYAHHQARQVLQQAEIAPQRLQTDFRILHIQHQGDYQTLIIETLPTKFASARKIYANWQLEPLPQMGEIWRGELKLRPISSRLNQGGFDRQAWYFAQGISAYASVKTAVKIGQDFSWRDELFSNYLQQTQNLSQQGLLMALAFGERAWLNSEVWQIYQQTNTAHLIAISGLHIGLAMALGFLLARALQFALPTTWITPTFPYIVGLIVALIYAQLAGFAIPTFRAALALSLLFGLKFLRAYCTPWQLYFRALALLLCCDPMMILSASFHLSAGAVACLILWYQLFPLALLQWKAKPLSPKVRWILALFHLQLGLFLLFTPIQLLLFDGFCWLGLLANLLVVPIFSLILVPLVLFALLTEGALFSWQIANALAEACNNLLSHFQFAWLFLSQRQIYGLSALLLLLFAGLAHYIYRQSHSPQFAYKPPKLSLVANQKLRARTYYKIQLCIGAAMLFFISKLGFSYWQQADWRIESLDVGQGLATLIVKNQRGILYDTGASWRGGSMAELEILPYLRRQGIELDYVIISHDDNDHAGGAKAILPAFPNAQLITPSQLDYQSKIGAKIHRSFCQAGENWQWQGLQIQALSPNYLVGRAKNADSCVLLVSDKQHNLLLMGDADSAVEQRILSQLPQIEVLQVGHHGSKTSTHAAFVQQIQPQIALISAGRWNPWHFPHQQVLANLNAAQTAVYNSAVFGQVAVKFYGQNREIELARDGFSPWFRQLVGNKTGD